MQEYQDWYQSMAPLPKDPVKCPVCKSLLGYRLHKTEPFMEHCEECKATYTWKIEEKVPTALLDKDRKKKKCNCGRCD